MWLIWNWSCSLWNISGATKLGQSLTSWLMLRIYDLFPLREVSGGRRLSIYVSWEIDSINLWVGENKQNCVSREEGDCFSWLWPELSLWVLKIYSHTCCISLIIMVLKTHAQKFKKIIQAFYKLLSLMVCSYVYVLLLMRTMRLNQREKCN